MKKANEIQPIGSYFELDDQGYVINPASLDKIQEEWKPVIDAVVEAYKHHLGSTLKNVYIRGSVAKGTAIKNISDLDSFAYVDLPKDTIDHSWEKKAGSDIQEQYQFVEGVELMTRPLAIGAMNIIHLNQAVCVYGEPINVPKLKPGKDMLFHIPNLEKRMRIFETKLQSSESEESIKEACVWFAKDILRTGFELTMERSGKYTRDLYLNYKAFSEYYPEKETQMREVLYYAINPTSDKNKIEEIKTNLLSWLVKEVKRIY